MLLLRYPIPVCPFSPRNILRDCTHTCILIASFKGALWIYHKSLITFYSHPPQNLSTCSHLINCLNMVDRYYMKDVIKRGLQCVLRVI